MAKRTSFGKVFSRATSEDIYERTGISRNLDILINEEQLEQLLDYLESAEQDDRGNVRLQIALFDAEGGKSYDSSGNLSEGYKPQEKSSGRAGGRRKL